VSGKYKASETAVYAFTVELPRLGAAANLAYSDYTLSWDAVTGASNGYRLLIEKSGAQVSDETLTAAQKDVSALEPGAYAAKVTALATAENRASETAELNFTVNAPTPLGAPTGFSYGKAGQSVSWNAVENAVGYKVSAVKKGTQIVTISERTVTDTTLSVLGLNESAHDLTVVAVAGAVGLADSAPAYYDLTIQTNPLPEAQNFVFDAEGDRLSWSGVPGNDGYLVEIYSGENPVLSGDIIDTSYGTAPLGIGVYTAKLTVFAPENAVYFGNSAASELPFEIVSLGDLPTPANLTVGGGFLSWNSLSNVGYNVVVKELGGDAVETNEPYIRDSRLMLTALNLADGDYTVSVSATSNRHNTSVSAAASKDITIVNVKTFTAADISAFSGTAPAGEHGAVSLITADGVQYAQVAPAPMPLDGWGRVGSPEFSVNFDKKPVVYLSMGAVVGGFHLQMQYNDQNGNILNDTFRLGEFNADIANWAAGELIGEGTIRLRLGVNGSTDGTNDARANYRLIKVLYVSEYAPPVTEPEELPAPENVRINNAGNVAWSSVPNAESYKVTVKEDSASENYFEGELSSPVYAAYLLPEGIYTVRITAASTEELFEDSEETSYRFRVEYAANYTPQNMDTAAGIFEPVENGIGAVYSSGTGFVTLNGAGSSSHGWFAPKTGVALNMDKTPIIILTLESVTGGYLARASYTGSSGLVVMKNDTSVTITERTMLVMRANVNVDSNPIPGGSTGIKENYKFMMGVTGGGSKVTMSNMRIVYVTEYDIPAPPEEPEKLNAPAGGTADKTIYRAEPVAGNAAHIPTYEIVITKLSGGGEVAKVENSLTPAIDLSAYALVSGEEYSISVTALGDGVYFADSDPLVKKLVYTEYAKLADFTSIPLNMNREGTAPTIASQGESGIVFTLPGGDWGTFSVSIDLTGVTVESGAFLRIDFGAATAATGFFARYYTSAAGSANTTPIGDTTLTGNQILTGALAASNLSGDTLYLGFGHGGTSGPGGAVKSIEITAVMLGCYAVSAIA
jgi:hypothetical protein